MKVKLSRMWRTGLSLLLVFCMALSIFPAAAFAAEETINYVSIGDSMANGYCFEGYQQGRDNGINFLEGTGVYGIDAYPEQFEEYLAESGAEVNHTKLALSALRAEDLNYLLGGREEPTDGWENQVNGYAEVEDDAVLAEFYQEAVINADVITLGIGNASFGAYMLHRVTDALGVFGAELEGDEIVTLEEALEILDFEQKEVILEAYDVLKAELLGAIPGEYADQFNVNEICDILAYTAAGFLVNYEGALEQIVKLNPDVEIVLVGLMNTTYGMIVTADGMDPIPVGDIMDEFFGVLNAYVAGLPAAMQAAGQWKDAAFYYAEQPNPLFISQQFAALKEAGWDKIDEGRLSGDIVRDRNIDAYNDSLLEEIGGLFGAQLPETNLTAVKDFEALTVQEFVGKYAQLTNSTAYAEGLYASTAVYLGIEDAVAASCDTMEIPLDGLVTIATDISSVFSGLNIDRQNIRESLGDALTANDTMKGMCKIYALFKVGNGMSVHPTPSGHDEIAKAVIDAYANKHTVLDETTENIEKALAELIELIEEYGYEYLEDAGYIDALEGAADRLEEELNARVENYINTAKPAMEEALAELQAEAAALEASLIAMKAELEAQKALLEAAAGDTAEDALAMKAQIEEAIAVLEESIAAVEAELFDIEAAAAALEEGIANVEEELYALLDAAEELAESIDTLLNTAANAVDGTAESAMAAAEAAWNTAEAAVKLIETGYEQLVFLTEEVAGFAESVYEEVSVLAGMVAADLQDVYDMLPDEVKAELEAAALAAKAAIEEELAAKIAELKAALEPVINAKIEELTALYEAKKAELEALISAKEAELNGLLAELAAAAEEKKAEIEAEIAMIEAELEALKAELEAAAEELEAAVLEAKAELEAKIAEVTAIAEEKLAELKASVEEVVGEAIDSAEELVAAAEVLALEFLAEVEAKVEEAVTAFEEAYKDATTAEYAPDEDSFYVAIGDSSAVSESYVDALAEELGVAYENLAKEDLMIEDSFAVVSENAESIAKADLITIGFTSNGFVNETIDYVLGQAFGGAVLDWAAYVGEENLPYVEQILEELNALILESTEDEQSAALLSAAVEAYAYSCAAYAFNLPELVDAIREINEDAVVVIVGMYNPLEDMSIQLDENTTIAIGEYMDYLTMASDVYAVAYAMLTGDATFVSAPDVETAYEAGTDLYQGDLIQEYLRNKGKAMLPSEAGHAYIAAQIANALVECEHIGEWVETDPASCTEPGEESFICSKCDKVLDTRPIEATGHDMSLMDYDEDGHWNYCSVCGTPDEKVPHTFDDDNCICGAQKPTTGGNEGGNEGGGGSSGGGGGGGSRKPAVINRYFSADGKGEWVQYKDLTWSFLIDGEKAIGWEKIDNIWYYFNEDGIMHTGWLKDVDGKWYYLASSGAMVTGWMKDAEGNWYYFNGNGSMRTGWVEWKGEWYYLDGSGKMVTLYWLLWKGEWYYFGSEGNMFYSRWHQLKEVWYYFFQSGAMAKDTVVDGNYFNSNGAWVR